MLGYNPDFLGSSFKVPLPTFSESFAPDVLTARETPEIDFQNGAYVRYQNYSVAMNKDRRQPIVVALNIDQDLLKSVRRGKWKTDRNVGRYQLDNTYYRNNEYDRGHLARRASAAWGETEREAKAASDATMFYTNAALQHANFNQDEWLFLETWVKDLQQDSTNKISVFSGPIYTSRNDSSSYIGNPPAMIPTAFFKVVVFIDRQGKLATRAFLMAQDSKAISDKNAKKRNFDLGAYQVPVKLIEEETGLVFDPKIRETNPIIFTEPPTKPAKKKPVYPVIIPVDPNTVQPGGGKQPSLAPDSKLAIICAMINARGDESRNEWVTIANFGPDKVDLSGWTLSDRRRTPLPLSGILKSGEAKRIDDLYSLKTNTGVRLSNSAGQIVLLTPDEDIADRVTYSKRSRVIQEGVPVTFHLDEHVSSDGNKEYIDEA